jgi:hypothetical protein
MWDVALFLDMPCSVIEQALVDMRAVVSGVSIFATPEAVHVVFIGAMLPPICEVVEPCIEHGSGNVQGCWGIVENVWLKAVKGVGVGQGMQGVVLLLSSIIVLLLDIGQLFSQIFDPIMCMLEALYFSMEGFVLLLLDHKVDHGGECFSWEEGVCLLLCEYPSRIWVFPCPEQAWVLKAVMPLWQEKLGVVKEEIILVKRGLHHSSSEPKDGVGVLQWESLDVAEPIISQYDPWFFDKLWS